VEVILSSALFLLFVGAVAGALIYGTESIFLSGTRTRALFLAEEGIEGARNIRDGVYGDLVAGTYGLVTTTNQWGFYGTSGTAEMFTRTVEVGVMDGLRKIVTSTVTWRQTLQRAGRVTLVALLTNWLAASGGGGGAGGGGWATPAADAAVDLSSNTDGIKVAVNGNYAYVVQNGGVDLAIIDINTTTPFLAGSLTLAGTPHNIFVTGTFAYVASDSNTQELQIIDISSPTAPALIGSYDAAGATNAEGIFVSGTMAYLTRGSSANDELFVLNVATPAAPALAGSLNLGVSAFEVWVTGTFAYMSSDDNAQEVLAVNVSDPTAMTIVGSLNLPGNANAITIAGFTTTTLVGQGTVLHTVDITSPAAPAVLGSLDMQGTVYDVGLDFYQGNMIAFVATASTTGEFAIVNIQTLASPQYFGSADIAAPLQGVAYSSLRDEAYGAGESNTEEFYRFVQL
jgi:hypothetical protein